MHSGSPEPESHDMNLTLTLGYTNPTLGYPNP